MQVGRPSRTALGAATYRAVHQVVEGGILFRDSLAVKIVGRDPGELAHEAAAHPELRPLRWFLAARSRFAEDSLTVAVGRGVRQLVVLGAGLDTFAYRNPHERAGLVVFEVDHPATQAWKRERLSAAGIAIPSSLRFVPVDFESEDLAEELMGAGFDPSKGAFFSWLGVVPYLTREAVFANLGFIAGLPGGGEVVFDYSDPPHALAEEQRAAHDALASGVHSLGERFLSHYAAEPLAADLRALGFDEIEDLGPSEMGVRYFRRPAGDTRRSGGHLVRARRIV